MSNNKENNEGHHPADSLLHTELIPSVWCPGCGIGTVVYTFLQAIKKAEIDVDNICIVSGIGCTGKVGEYLKIESYNATEGNLIDYAANIKLENPELKVVVFQNNADFLVSGAADFIRAAERGVELLVIHINNVLFMHTEQEYKPITPFIRTSVDKDFELPFNIPHLAKTHGAQYIARWTPLRAGWLLNSMKNALSRKGFSLIEVISPCLMYYTNDGKIGDSVDRMEFYSDNSVIKKGEPTENLDIRAQNKIIIGKFVE